MDRMALATARKMLAFEGRYCEIIRPPEPVDHQTFRFFKRDPLTGQVFRVTWREEVL